MACSKSGRFACFFLSPPTHSSSIRTLLPARPLWPRQREQKLENPIDQMPVITPVMHVGNRCAIGAAQDTNVETKWTPLQVWTTC